MAHAATPSSHRYYPRWQGITPGWQQVVVGLALFPPTLYMALFALQPLFVASVLLLDAAPALSTPIVGGIVTVAIAAVGWLLNRAITTADANVQELKAVVGALTKLVGEIGTEQKASGKLTEYLEKRVNTLEQKKEVLEKSFAQMDKLIAVKLAEKHPNT